MRARFAPRSRADVVALVDGLRGKDHRSRFRLGQDENDATFPEILHDLEQGGQQRLVDRMRRFNPARS